jgi:DNA-binding MarR family transcriptional regulator
MFETVARTLGHMQTHSPDAQGRESARPPARPATHALREILDVSDDFAAALAHRLGVNLTDLNAMQHLIMAGPLSPSTLAKRVGLSTAAMTTAIDRLEAIGHVQRTANPDDRRSLLIEARPESRQKAMGMLMPMIGAVDAVLDEFDDHDQEAITRYLARVVEIYRCHSAQLGADGAHLPDGR